MPPLEFFVIGQHTRATDALEARHPGKPVPDLSHRDLIVAVMRFDVRTGEVGNRRLVAVTLFLKDENYLFAQSSRSVAAASKVQAQLEGHVEAIVLTSVPGLTPAKIVNGVSG